MNAFWQSPLIIVAVFAWLAAPPQSLGEAAQRESLRRRAMPKSRVVLTNLGQPPEIPPVSADTPVVAAPGTPPVEEPVKAGSEPAEVKKDETWWRKRISAAREAVRADQSLAQTIQSRINVLQREVVNEDNPVKQGQFRQELKDKIAELEQTNKKVAAGQQTVTAIQEEARRLDVPPGWIR